MMARILVISIKQGNTIPFVALPQITFFRNFNDANLLQLEVFLRLSKFQIELNGVTLPLDQGLPLSFLGRCYPAPTLYHLLTKLLTF